MATIFSIEVLIWLSNGWFSSLGNPFSVMVCISERFDADPTGFMKDFCRDLSYGKSDIFKDLRNWCEEMRFSDFSLHLLGWRFDWFHLFLLWLNHEMNCLYLIFGITKFMCSIYGKGDIWVSLDDWRRFVCMVAFLDNESDRRFGGICFTRSKIIQDSLFTILILRLLSLLIVVFIFDQLFKRLESPCFSSLSTSFSLVFSCRESFLSVFRGTVFSFPVSVSFFGLNTMSQSAILNGSSKGKQVMKIKIPKFDNSELIKGCERSLIGRAMNPKRQDLSGLIKLMPKFWKMEDRVTGSDLGVGKVQFDFEREEDLLSVLKSGPFHFDGWMVALVRWEPIVHPDYPSAITFWIKVLGVPRHFRAVQTFQGIGNGLGYCSDVDVSQGLIRVTLDGFKPLCFDTMIEFFGGEETGIKLEYLRLVGFCSICFSLCHDEEFCPDGIKVAEVKSGLEERNPNHRGNRRLRDEEDEGNMRHERRPVRRALEYADDGDREVAQGDSSQGEKGVMETADVVRQVRTNDADNDGFKAQDRRSFRGYGGFNGFRKHGSGFGGKFGNYKGGYPSGGAPRYRRVSSVRQTNVTGQSLLVEDKENKEKMVSSGVAGQFLDGQGLIGVEATRMNPEAASGNVHALTSDDSILVQNGKDQICTEPVSSTLNEEFGIEDGEIKNDFDDSVLEGEFDELAEYDPNIGFAMEGDFNVDDQLLEEEPVDDQFPDDGQFLVDQLPIDGTEDLLSTDSSMIGAERDQVTTEKDSGLTHGYDTGSKKRNVSILASPRRRANSKSGVNVKDAGKDKSGKVALPKLPAGT